MIIYDGKSRIDKKPIVAVLIGGSSNRKTGNMAQTYIIRKDVSPVTAIKTGEDKSICGNCVHRGVADGEKAVGRSCYVTVFQGPLSVFNAYKRGIYPKYNKDLAEKILKNKTLRLGTYGDPTAVPIDIWKNLVRMSKGHTGYTHGWTKKKNKSYRELCMASVDNETQITEALANGWRYFRTRMPNSPVLGGEFECPASEEQGKRKTCEECGACWGANKTGSNPFSVSIVVHGGPPVISNAKKNLIQLGLKLNRKE